MSEADFLSDELLGGLLEEAEKQQEAMSSYSQFGRLTYGPVSYKKFPKEGGVEEITKEEYFEMGVRDKIAELVVRVDIQELNPDLDWTYERRVGMGSVDWREHWKKSVVDVYNLEERLDKGVKGKERKSQLNQLVKEAMTDMAGKYVEIADVPQEPKKSDKGSDKVFRTPELRQVFKSREECVAAITERFGSAPSGAVAPAGEPEAPEGFDTYQDFVDTVALMREDGSADHEIAKQLGVSVTAVARAK